MLDRSWRRKCSALPMPARSTVCSMLQRTSTSDIWRRDLLQDAAMTDLRLDSVTCRFGDAVAVDGIDLVVAQGELGTLLGPSGCGKTTTFPLIAGHSRSAVRRLLPRAPAIHS